MRIVNLENENRKFIKTVDNFHILEYVQDASVFTDHHPWRKMGYDIQRQSSFDSFFDLSSKTGQCHWNLHSTCCGITFNYIWIKLFANNLHPGVCISRVLSLSNLLFCLNLHTFNCMYKFKICCFINHKRHGNHTNAKFFCLWLRNSTVGIRNYRYFRHISSNYT